MSFLVIFTANYAIFLVALIAIAVILLSKRTICSRIIGWPLLSFIIAFAKVHISELFYYDPRPFVLKHVTSLIPHSADNGFPSDRTRYAMVTTATILTFKCKTGILLGILAVLMELIEVNPIESQIIRFFHCNFIKWRLGT